MKNEKGKMKEMAGWSSVELAEPGRSKSFSFFFTFFFLFFHLFRQSPPKNLQIQNVAVTLTLTPRTSHLCAPHTTPYTVVLVLL